MAVELFNIQVGIVATHVQMYVSAQLVIMID